MHGEIRRRAVGAAIGVTLSLALPLNGALAACPISGAEFDGMHAALTGSNAKAAGKALTTLSTAAKQSGAECVAPVVDALIALKVQANTAPALRAPAAQLLGDYTQSGKVSPALVPGLLRAAGSGDVAVSGAAMQLLADYMDYGAEPDVANIEPLFLAVLSNKDSGEAQQVAAAQGIGAEVRRKLRRNSVFPAIEQILGTASFGAAAAGTHITTALASYSDGYEVLADSCKQAAIGSNARTACNAAFKSTYRKNVVADVTLQGYIDGMLTQFALAPLSAPDQSCTDTEAAADLAAQMGIKANGLKAALKEVAGGSGCGKEAAQRALAAMN